MAQRVQRVSVKYALSESQLYEALDESGVTVKSVIIGANHVTVISVNDLESSASHGMYNPIIAAFVSCYGRLELFKELNRLQERALYTGMRPACDHFVGP